MLHSMISSNLSDEEFAQMAKENRPYLNRIVRQRLSINWFMALSAILWVFFMWLFLL